MCIIFRAFQRFGLLGIYLLWFVLSLFSLEKGDVVIPHSFRFRPAVSTFDFLQKLSRLNVAGKRIILWALYPM